MGAAARSATAEKTKAQLPQLMEAVVERGNLWSAYQRVVANKGAPGVDGIRVCEFKDWLKVHWPTVRAALLARRYMPRAVRAVQIPKPSGKGSRLLPSIARDTDAGGSADPTGGAASSATDLRARIFRVQLWFLSRPQRASGSQGCPEVRSGWQADRGDLDLEKFFDRLNHDILMSQVARQVKDERVLKLIRRYLEAGLMQNGLVQPRTEGSPQGGPLSPLLSNILLTDLDRELERRGHAFCRYADDCSFYVGSWTSAEHAMAEITEFLHKKLKLTVNREKCARARPWKRKFRGYSFTHHKQAKLKVALESLKRLRTKVRECLNRGRGWALSATISKLASLLRGWMNYFRLTEAKGVLAELDRWLRRKLRCLLWRQWKHRRGRFKALVKLGVGRFHARQIAGNWRFMKARHLSGSVVRWFRFLCQHSAFHGGGRSSHAI